MLCKREANEHERTNKDGVPFWVWRLGETDAWQAERVGPDTALCPRASPDVLDRVYRELFARLSLSREHREHLRARGLSDPQIDQIGPVSLPAASRREIAEALVDRFGDEVRGVPGIYVKTVRGKTQWSVAGRAGLLIPTYSLEGQLVSVRIRDDSGYTFLSSTRHGGAKALPALYRPPWVATGELVRVTEGELKACVASVRDGIPTLGLPGHGQWRLLPEALRAMGARRVLVSFDRDPSERTRGLVERSRADLAESLTDYVVGFETWPLEAGKAIDDVPLEAVRQVWDSPVRPALPMVAREVYDPLEGMPEPLPPEQGAALIREFLRRTWAGVYVVHAETGLGKTRAAADIAMERARAPYKSSNARGERAPPNSKTAIVLPSHAIALQAIAYLEGQGFTDYYYLRGSTAVEREPGEPECIYHVAASALARGKQRIKMVLCDGCERSGHCPAENASRGRASARVLITVHPLLEAAAKAVGTTGMVILDESLPSLEQFAWERNDLRHAIAELPSFNARYADGMAPALRVLEEALALATEPLTPCDIRKPLGSACESVASARDERELGPPLTLPAIGKARASGRRAEHIGAASEVLDAVERAVMGPFRSEVSIEVRADHPNTLRLTMPNVPLLRAMQNAPVFVILDAFGDTQLPVIEAYLGHLQNSPVRPNLRAEGRYLRVSCADGAPIDRTWIRSNSATRGKWLPIGPLKPNLWRGALRAFAVWVREQGHRKVGLITYQRIADWLRDGGLHELELVGVDVILGHYGAVRGSDAWKDCDGLATLGDARPNVGATLEAARYAELAAPQAYLAALAADEHGQAHGRIRAPHRTAPAGLFHYGAIPPAGYGWQRYRLLEAQSMGRPKASRAIDGPQLRTARLKAGKSQRELSAELSISQPMLAQMESGVRPVTASVAAWVNGRAGDKHKPIE